MDSTAPAPPIAVIGAGAVGGCVAAHLGAAGADIVLCVRHRFERLRLEVGPDVVETAPRVETEPDAVRPLPWVLLATKAHQTGGAAPWLRALAGPGSTVAILQNGVEHEARVRPYAGDAELLPVVVECPVSRTAPGRITRHAAARLVVPATSSGHAFARLFAGTQVAVDARDDFVTALWRKLCLNVAGGPLLALTGCTMGVVRSGEVARLARELVGECIRVGRAEGADLNDALADEIVDALQRGDPAAGTSMLADRNAGRVLEADARNGAVVRIGRCHGIDTPMNRAVAALLTAVNRPFPSTAEPPPPR